MVVCLIVASLILSCLVQGGFYGVCYLLIGVICLTCFLFAGNKLPPLSVFMPFLVLCVLYIVASIVHGGGYDSLVFAARPLVSLAFFMLIYNFDHKDKLLRIVMYSALCVAFVSVVAYGLKLPGMVSNGRLQGTFQYANAAGIYFAAVALAVNSTPDKKLKAMSIPFEVALLLTQSVGAIACWVLGYAFICIFGRVRLKKEVCVRLIMSISAAAAIYLLSKFSPAATTLAAIALFAVYARLYNLAERLELTKIAGAVGAGLGAVVIMLGIAMRHSALYTYIERLIQLWDSVIVTVSRPIMGLGPWVWQQTYPFWQTYPYNSAYLHSSVGQTGIDIGVPGLACLLYLFYLYFKQRRDIVVWTAGLMIVAHSLLDITFNFSSLTLLLIVLFYINDTGKPVVIRRRYSAVAVFITLCCVAYLFAGQLILRTAATDKDFERFNGYFYNSYSNNYKLLTWYAQNNLHEKAVDLKLPYNTAEGCLVKSRSLLELGRQDEAWAMALECIKCAPMQDVGYKWATKVAGTFPLEKRNEYLALLEQLKETADKNSNILSSFLSKRVGLSSEP